MNKIANRHTRRIGPMLVVCSALAAGGANAAWETIPDISIRAETDDNVRLSVIDTGSSSRSVLDARFRLSNFGERGNAYIEPRVVTDAYADALDKNLESDDVFFTARARYDWQKMGFGFDSVFAEESVLRAEFDSALPDDPDAGEPADSGAGTTGSFQSQRRRSDTRARLDFVASERTTVRVEARYIDVAYVDDSSIARTPFDDKTAAFAIIRRVDERNSVSTRMFVSEYNAVSNNNATDTFGVEGTFARPLSQTWRLNLTAGVQRNDFSYFNALGQFVDNADSNYTIGVTISKRSELTDWTVGFGRYINPNSDGFLAVRNELRASVDREFSERFSASFGVRWSEFAPVGEIGALGDSTERNYLRSSIELEWAVARRWFVTAGLDYVGEERNQVLTLDANSTMIFLGMTYRGLSRQ